MLWRRRGLCPSSFEPPRLAIVLDKTTWSRELIERSGMFGIVIPGVAATKLDVCGRQRLWPRRR
ncbi:flavin reductase-like protein [Citrobacter koseri]|uniref:Flavin reductase-like protein n=1 Tax=Citrobacter koseri TaxID=545 RepID=A0A2X2WJU7_CITKO|nr:flavin reductase-like protein [Citrobacter koseri]